MPVCDILDRRFVRDEHVFLISYSFLEPCTHCVDVVSNLFDSWDDLHSSESEHHSFIIQYPVKTSISSGQPVMLSNYVKALTYLLMVLL